VSIALGALQVFIGVGTIPAGLALILEPSGASLGMPLEWLSDSPFPNFLIPGVVLMVVNGFGRLAGALASFLRYRYAGEIAMGLGVFLMLWIVARMWWIGLATGCNPCISGSGRWSWCWGGCCVNEPVGA
jgi:hypothetical protein